jgi:hypothetical protein
VQRTYIGFVMGSDPSHHVGAAAMVAGVHCSVLSVRRAARVAPGVLWGCVVPAPGLARDPRRPLSKKMAKGGRMEDSWFAKGADREEGFVGECGIDGVYWS